MLLLVFVVVTIVNVSFKAMITFSFISIELFSEILLFEQTLDVATKTRLITGLIKFS